MLNKDLSALIAADDAHMTIMPGIVLHRYHTARTGYEDMLALSIDAPRGFGSYAYYNAYIDSRDPNGIRREVAKHVIAYFDSLAADTANNIINH